MPVFAQENTWSIQISDSPGKLIKHTDKFKFKPSGLSRFYELDVMYHTQGRQDWEIYNRLPRIGLGVRYMHLGAPSEILGDGFSFFPFIDFGFFQKKKSSLRLKMGTGLVYLNKTYHIKYNSSQTAIGSHWNNLTTFQCRYEHALIKMHFLSAGISLSHISNGAFKAPNLGLNFISAIFGYSFHFQPATKKLALSTPEDVNPHFFEPDNSSVNSTISMSVEYGITLKEADIPGGPKFFVQWYMLDVGYQYNNYNSLRLSVDLEQNRLDIYKEPLSDGKRLNIYLAHQWLFGDVGLTFRAGYEFIKFKKLNNYPIVSKLDLCYIMPFQLLQYARPFLGFSLKTHLDTAEYIGVMAGIRYHNNKNRNN